MRKLSSLLCVTLLAAAPFAYSASKPVKDGFDVIYVSDDSVQTIDGQILISTDEGYFTTSALYSGDDGLYVYVDDLSYVDDSAEQM